MVPNSKQIAVKEHDQFAPAGSLPGGLRQFANQVRHCLLLEFREVNQRLLALPGSRRTPVGDARRWAGRRHRRGVQGRCRVVPGRLGVRRRCRYRSRSQPRQAFVSAGA